MKAWLKKLRHPRRCYLVCAVARSGSNMLTDGLHATRRAGRPNQYFLPSFEAYFGEQHSLSAADDFVRYVRGIVDRTATSNGVFGFKLMAWYLADFVARLRKSGAFGTAEATEMEILRDAFPRLQFIHIARRDRLQQAISKARAIQTGLWKVQQGQTAAADPEFDASLIDRCLWETEREENVWSDFFQRNGIVPYEVEYEQMCEDYEAIIASVFEFLRITVPQKSRVVQPTTVRQSDGVSLEWRAQYLARQTNNGHLASA
ncbi:MAG: Stf0 family sulfotransferase [Chthoniobacterales bacterium]